MSRSAPRFGRSFFAAAAVSLAVALAVLSPGAQAERSGVEPAQSAAPLACTLFTKQELSVLMGEPVADGQGTDAIDASRAFSVSTCTIAVVDRPFRQAIVTVQRFDAAKAPDLTLDKWYEQVETLIATNCQAIDRANAKNISTSRVSGLGDRAVACSHDIVVGTTVMGGVSQLHVFQGPRIVQIVVRRRDAETRSQLRILGEAALARLGP